MLSPGVGLDDGLGVGLGVGLVVLPPPPHPEKIRVIARKARHLTYFCILRPPTIILHSNLDQFFMSF